MCLLKTTCSALGLLAISILGMSNYLNAASSEILESPALIQAVEVIIPLDRFEQINLPSGNPHPPQPDPLTASECNWEITHSLFNIFSDLTALAGSGIFIATQSVVNPLLFPLSAGMAAGCQTIDFFRGYTKKLNEIKQNAKSLSSVCTMLNAVGQVASITGLCFLAGGLSPVDIGVWVLVGGGLLKLATFSTELGTLGMAQTFGDDHTFTNSIFRIGFLGVGGNVGGLILATGISVHSPEIIAIGIYTLGGTNMVGTLEILVRDIQDLDSLVKIKTQLAPAVIHPTG